MLARENSAPCLLTSKSILRVSLCNKIVLVIAGKDLTAYMIQEINDMLLSLVNFIMGEVLWV